jgi:hypothetical protein
MALGPVGILPYLKSRNDPGQRTGYLGINLLLGPSLDIAENAYTASGET